jgi:Do/DeqQ family serine protease
MKKLLIVNLVLVGLITGFVFSVLLFSCSTQVEPSSSVSAQDRPVAGRAQLESLQQSFREISSVALPSVVRIDVEEVRTRDVPEGGDAPWFDFFFGEPDQESPDGNREFRTQGLGSGVIVRRDGETHYVLTNDHVVGNATEITITLDDQREFAGRMVGSDRRKDLALLAFDSDEDIPVAVLGDSSELQVGDWVLAIGSPFGFQSTVTAGIVSAVGRRGGPDGNISDFIQTDAAINRGNSGGALVNLNGEVVGINTWITSATGGSVGLGFSIPVNNVVRSIDDFITTGAVRYGWLGVSIRSVPEEIVSSMSLPDRRGALVYHVFRGSPADNGGLLPGDFITEINGVRVSDSDQLVLEVGELPVGEIAVFELIRYGRSRRVEVRIAERESDQQIATLNSRLWPGFSVFPLTDDLREELEADIRTGVVISTVENRTPAAGSGMRVGDVITTINGQSIGTMVDFYRALNESSRGVTLSVVRDGEEIEIEFGQ